MPEALAHDLRMDAVAQELGSVGVTEIVKPDTGQIGLADKTSERRVEAVGRPRAAIRAPGGAADRVRGRVVKAFSESIDIMPTVLDMLDHDIPLQCDGASLRPFLAGQNPEGWRTEVHWELDFRDRVHGQAQAELGIGLDDCSLTVIRDERYKYVHFAALPPLFFDLDRDPGECENLAADPDHASRVLTYAQKMLSWRLTHAERTLTGIRLTPQGPIEIPRAER